MRSEFAILRKIWPVLRTVAVACGLSEWLLRHGRLGLVETRRHLALQHLPDNARGLEIGALHCPLPLPAGTKARYVDRHATEALRDLRADVGPVIVTPDLLADGFSLDCILAASQDFIIANHVLEHATDVLGTLENWLRALRPGGVLFVAVPIGERCFDRGRTITAVEHFIEDRRLVTAGETAVMRARNRVHVEEYLTIAAPAIAQAANRPWHPPDGVEREQEIERLLGKDAGRIHHHVFTPASFGALLDVLGKQIHIERIAHSRVETLGILRKAA